MSTMRDVDDGVIKGYIDVHRRRCSHCGTATLCINIEYVNLNPNQSIVSAEITPSSRMIFYRNIGTCCTDQILVPENLIGIGCGCYAKGQRQIAYIRSQAAKDSR